MNNTILSNQIAGVMRVVLPSAIAWLVARNYMPAELAGPVVETLVVLVPLLGSAALDWISNRGKAVTQQAGSQTGVTIEVRPNAAPEIKEVAMDPAEYGVVPVK